MKILLAEDDPLAAKFTRKGLEQSGYSVDCVDDGRDAVNACLYTHYDVIILDRTMLGLDGLSVVKALRSSDIKTPVLFLTAMVDVDDRVEGLMAGGDDYLDKPFHFSELLARVTALSRRHVGSSETTILACGDLELDLHMRAAKRDGKVIELLNKEFSLLEMLMRNEGRIITKTMLLEQVWDFNFDPQTTVVETHISRLRTKIDKPFGQHYIHTVRNVGYVCRVPS